MLSELKTRDRKAFTISYTHTSDDFLASSSHLFKFYIREQKHFTNFDLCFRDYNEKEEIKGLIQEQLNSLSKYVL